MIIYFRKRDEKNSDVLYMDFYTIILIISVIILILVLTGLGLMLTKVGSTGNFPPTPSPCPDGWNSQGSSCTGTSGINFPNTYPKNATYSKNSPGYINWYFGSRGISNTGGETPQVLLSNITLDTNTFKNVCDQKIWANANKITWDGVTNSNAKC